jgi:hypothetical protein
MAGIGHAEIFCNILYEKSNTARLGTSLIT